jgi:putative membrane protein
MDRLHFPRCGAAAAVALLLAGATAGAFAQASAPGAGSSARPAASAPATLARSDRSFVLEAADDGMAEVELGKLAQQKGSSDAVKSYGAKMVEDHGKANGELKSIAAAKGITLPTAPSAKHQKALDAMGKRSGADFDKAYARQMQADHRKAVALFQKQSKSGADADLKAFAAKTLPTLQQHLDHARSLDAPAKAKS